MFPYTSQTSSSSFATRTFQSGGQSVGWITGQSCRKKCRCSGDGGGCRCKTSCRQTGPAGSRSWATPGRSWASPGPSRLTSFDDTEWSGEIGRRGGRGSYPTPRYSRGGQWRRSPYASRMRPYAGGRGWGQRQQASGGRSWGAGRAWGSRRSWGSAGGWSGRYTGQGSFWNRRGWGSSGGFGGQVGPGSAGSAGSPGGFDGGGLGPQGGFGQVLRSNGLWARRLGWGQYSPLIAQAIGSPSTSPYSASFAGAIARWQRRFGLTPTGVLSPRTWTSLRAMMAGGGPPPEPPPPPPPSPPAEPPIGDAAAAAPPAEPAAAAPDAGAGDAGGDPAAPPDGGAAPGGDAAAGEWYELARWANP